MPSTSRARGTGERLTRARLAVPGVISTSTSGDRSVAHHLAADDGALGAEPDQRRVLRDPVRAEGREVADRLDQVGLALPVRPDERVTPGSSGSSTSA